MKLSENIGLSLALFTVQRVKQDRMGKKTLRLQVLITSSRCSSVRTLLKPIVDFLSRVKPNGYFILLDFAQFSSIIVFKKSSTSLTALSHSHRM